LEEVFYPASDSWNAGLAPLPTGRNGLAVAVVGDAIYAIGGRTSGGGPCSGFGAGVLATVERYDIAVDTWTTVASLLSPRQDLAAASVGGKIYVFGGCDASGSIVGDVDVYDPTTDTWSPAPTDMPNPRASFYAVETKGDTVYVIGGWDGVSPGLSTNDAYQVSQDAWTTGLLPMPTPRAEAGAVGHGGRIYIVGGGQPGFGAAVDANEVFKP
jgi:N-acetylneuraminic acid mutarotase